MGATFGEQLPDQVDRIANVSDAQLQLLGDIREIFKDRAALDREYAGKMQALAKKAADRKSKRMAALVVGDEPAKIWNEDTLQRSTLDHAYSQLIASMDNTVQDYTNHADVLTSQIFDATKSLERLHEGVKKKQMQFYQKILSDRDRVYNDRIKMKQKYDEECLEVESYRQKQDRAQDDRHASRAAKQFEQQQIDMLNGKNSYIISTAIANKTKAKFYTEDVPALEDQFQCMQKNLMRSLVSLLQHAQSLHAVHLTTLQSRVSSVQDAFSLVDADKDQELFIEHNVRPFAVPSDWEFEPCSGYYDTGEMSIEPAPKVYLQNKLNRCRAKLEEIAPILDVKKKDVEQLSTLVSAYTSDRGLGNSDEVSSNYVDAQHQLILLSSSASMLTTEIDNITAVLGDDEGARQPHSFKSASFSIPTTCGYCKSSIWGLSKQGKTCKLCGISVHSRCELKIPAECAGSQSKSASTGTDLSKVDSRASSISSTPTPSSFAHVHPHSEETNTTARILYDFTPTSPFELAVSEGSEVQILEEDDGSGWVKVADAQGGRGLVPSSYIGPAEDEPTTPQATAATSLPTAGGSGTYVRGLYAYQARGADELDVSEGELIELSAGSSGGTHYADGWWEGFDKDRRKGIFPSNYVESV